jgi:hypothetical protein
MSNGRMTVKECRMQKWPWPIIRYYGNIWLKGLSKTLKSVKINRKFNLTPPKDEGVLTTDPLNSLHFKC